MNTQRLAVVVCLALAATSTEALAKDPVVGVEWENMHISVKSAQDILTLTNNDKKLLCSGVTVASFNQPAIPLVTITYDRILDDPQNHEARLEIATGPIPVCHKQHWAQVEKSVQTFLKHHAATLTATLAAMQTHDPTGSWAYCNNAAAYANNIGFGVASNAPPKVWDTQVNMQLALHQLPRLYEQIDNGKIGISFSRDRVLEIVDAVNMAVKSDTTLNQHEHGFLLLYYLSRAFMQPAPIAVSQHATIKNRFGLFPKVQLHNLVGNQVRAVPTQAFITANDATILANASINNPFPDPAFQSFAQDLFQVATVSNPIAPFLDLSGYLFVVMETRNPLDSINQIMQPSDAGTSSDFRLRTKALKDLYNILDYFAAPNYTGNTNSCPLL